ncbi:MAG TPA: T9SS type A sorting domain-containing protein [Ohtaekwangia sp.]|uniref:T9SS type A sorting domain-containing protein n=1 Tax=Ohtaekwangia sp. TaxID=2066019 RepID=UPI002F951F19
MKLKARQTPRPTVTTKLSTKLIIIGSVFAVAGIIIAGIIFYLNVGVPLTARAATNISGVINSYLRVTAISSKTFTADNLSGSIADFAVGKTIMIYQAKGANIDNSNTSSYGTVSSLNNAGYYEFAVISARTGSGPYSITVTSLTNSYTAGGYVQLVSVPSYTDATVTGTITATPWSATQGRGGVVAFQVSNDLTLGGSINVSGQGFAGGANGGSNGDCPDNGTYKSTVNDFAAKGEGISTDGSLYARGAQANGGGGGNPHNAGGGAGSNHTYGGNGGQGYQPGGSCAVANAGGVGGKAFTYSSLTNRVFFGGGGGSGQQNNSLASSGANGGGIIVIRAKTVKSTCGGTYGFIADGANAANTGGNDGAGGGGGGGVIVLDVNGYSLTCGIIARANGGSGGNVTDAASHGGGAGGGVGIIMETNPTTNANVTIQSTVGTTGKDCAGCTSNTATPAGTPASSRMAISSIPGTGIITLPVKLLYFSGVVADNAVDLSWATASEENNDYFTIERSADGIKFDSILYEKGAGNSVKEIRYSATDKTVRTSVAYYRLKQTDYDKKYTYSNVVYVDTKDIKVSDEGGTISLYPNPVSDKLNVVVTGNGPTAVKMVNSRGNVVYTNTFTEQESQIDVAAMENGIYILEVTSGAEKKVEKIIVRH